MKKCSKCQEVKDTSEFTPRKDRPWCFTSSCKKCNALATLKRKQENPNSVKESQKRFAAKNRERLLEYRKERYHEVDKFKERNPPDPVKRNRASKKYYRKWFDIWDDVYYGIYKYRIIQIIPSVWYKIMKYGPEGIVIIVPRRLLIPKKVWL
jgi:hypothetical protein